MGKRIKEAAEVTVVACPNSCRGAVIIFQDKNGNPFATAHYDFDQIPELIRGLMKVVDSAFTLAGTATVQ